jgi:hypothetical protein
MTGAERGIGDVRRPRRLAQVNHFVRTKIDAFEERLTLAEQSSVSPTVLMETRTRRPPGGRRAGRL